MASIKKYKTAKGHSWRVQYRSPDGRSRTKQGFRTKTEAQAWADKNAASIHTQEWTAPEKGKTQIQELWDRWWKSKSGLAPSSQESLDASWRTHVKPRWGNVPISKVEPMDIQDWVDELSERRSPSVVYTAVEVLRGLLSDAVRFKLLKYNPATDIRMPPKRKPKTVTINEKQLWALVDASKRFKSLLLFLGYTGARFDEARHVRIKDVDTKRKRAWLRKTKSGEPRWIGVPQVVLDAMQEDLKGKLPNALVWTNMDGSPVSTPSRRSWFHSALDKARAADPDFPEITPHDLRHAAASILISKGASVAIVQRQLGHTSGKRTLDIYTHLFEDDLDSLIDSVTGIHEGAGENFL